MPCVERMGAVPGSAPYPAGRAWPAADPVPFACQSAAEGLHSEASTRALRLMLSMPSAGPMYCIPGPPWCRQAVKMYSSNSTVELLAAAAAEFAALGQAGPSLAPGAAPGFHEADVRLEAGAPVPEAAMGPPTGCPSCAEVEAAPLEAWALQAEAQNATAFHLPWGQDVLFGPVDYAAAAEMVCNCLAGEYMYAHIFPPSSIALLAPLV